MTVIKGALHPNIVQNYIIQHISPQVPVAIYIELNFQRTLCFRSKKYEIITFFSYY